MQIIKTDQLKKGMVTAIPVVTKHGQLIVNEGVILTEPLISKISFYSIDSIQIQDYTEAASSSTEEISEPTYLERIKDYAEFQNLQHDYTRAIQGLKSILTEASAENGRLDTDLLYQTVEPLLCKVSTSFEMFNILQTMRTIEDSIYAHSLNVALIASVLGRWLKMSERDLETLAVAALLHDIGKLRIPAEILDKPGKYTDNELVLVKKYPAHGYLMLLPYTHLNPHIKNAALMHQERCDGSGYPQKLKGNEIDRFAQVIAIADVYDAMTAARAYRAPICPFHVIADFENDGLQKYNPKFILTFLEGIAYTYQGSRIQLSDGRAANIIMLNKQFLSKPIVQVADGTCIDLSRTPDLHIQALL
ncbi:MAG: HD-GYP domain-containing protein [Eubacterium sp.]|nr:HD-GYP domain-containing protein [Eubacterium sp.]